MITKSVAILASIALVFVINSTILSEYSTFILGLLIIFSVIYITIKRRSKKDELFSGSPIEVFALIASVLLIIDLTDGLSSPLFFFLYFLLFGIAFLVNPRSVFVFLLGIILFYLPELTSATSRDLIMLGSLVLIAPIAYFFGNEFEKKRKLSEDVEDKTEKIIEEVEALEDNEESIEKRAVLEDIEKEADELRENSED